MIDWSKTITNENRLEEREKSARVERDFRISSSMWLVERHRSQLELGIKTSITREQYLVILSYHQSLRDITNKPEWPNVDIPPLPI